MKILQNTTDFSNKQVREIIDFVKPNNLPTWNFDVRLTHCTCGAGNGVYYDGQQNYTGHVNGEYGEYIIVGRPHIMLRVARESGKQKFPYYEDRSPKVRRPWRKVTLHYEKFNPKTQQYEEWHYTK